MLLDIGAGRVLSTDDIIAITEDRGDAVPAGAVELPGGRRSRITAAGAVYLSPVNAATLLKRANRPVGRIIQWQ